MATKRPNAPQESESPANTKPDTGRKVPGARPGGQTDSATGNKPGGGGQPQSGKK